MSECEHGFDPDEFDQADGAVYCEACIKKWKADSARLAKLNEELLSQPVTLRSVFDYFDDDDVEHRRIELTTYEGPDDERMSDDLYEAIDGMRPPQHSYGRGGKR